jgi:hypothetical protein
MLRQSKCFLLIAIAVLSKNVYANSSCDAIITHGLRNIEVAKSSEAAIATRYFNHCQKNIESLSDETLGKAELEIFGQGAGGGSYDRKRREERINDWCTTNRDLAYSNRTSFTESQVFYQGAVSAWEKCVALGAKDVRISPVISPDSRTVSIGMVYNGNTKSGILFYGVEQEGFTCNVTGPEGKKQKLPDEIKNLNMQVSCVRAPALQQTRNGEKFQVLPRGTITIQTASDPFQLYFPEEWDPGLPAKEIAQLRVSIRNAELPVGTIIKSALAPDQFANPNNYQYSADKWIVADGRTLPAGTRYEQLTGSKVAPDMRPEKAAFNVLDVVSVPKNHGENIVSAISETGKLGEWKWITSSRDVQGNRYNNDYEQDADQFQTFIDGNGVIIAQGRTLNFKHGQWGGWKTGSANLFGIALGKKAYYYYVKIN